MRVILFIFLSSVIFFSKSQNYTDIKLNPERVQMFMKYPEWKRGGPELFSQWKNTNKILYAKEMWYYTESFYVKRNVSTEGATMNESVIDITRFENQRKQDEEVTIQLPGYKDALVLIPENKLIYKP